MKINEQLDIAEAMRFLREEDEEEIDTREEVKADDQFDSFEDMMDFLAADEQQAIDGYDLVLEQIDDEFVKEQLTKIKFEEEAHKKYLEEVKKDRTIEYTEPLDQENGEEETEEVEETEEITEANDPDSGDGNMGWFFTKWTLNYLVAIGCTGEEAKTYVDVMRKTNQDHEAAMKAIGKDPNMKPDWSRLQDRDAVDQVWGAHYQDYC